MFKISIISVLLIVTILFVCENITAQHTGGEIEDIQAFCSNQKGFNLLGKFDNNWSNDGFKEKEFQAVQNLGFNFVRLPIDYRTYTLSGNWNFFVDNSVKNIDNAISWGEKYNVHVCLNLHRAPGYCVNSTHNLPANQQLDLWIDPVAQNAFVNHWKYFAERYKDVSPAILSFNLVNEPSNVSEEDYVTVMKQAIKAIHNITPERLIFVDGLNYAGDVILSLKDEPNIAQAFHSYQPFRLTHYKAGWVDGSDSWPVPSWPILAINSYLYGTWKSELKSPLVFLGNFEAGTVITINVNQVSIRSTLRIKADNQTIYSKEFVCGAEPDDDFTEVINTQWGYQNISNKDYSLVLEDSASKLSVENSDGDWMTLNSISIKNGNDSTTYYLGDNSWGKKQSTYKIEQNGKIKTEEGEDLTPFEDYKTNFALAKANNIPFMVQEFGVYNQTPHTTTLAFLNDLIEFCNEQNVGWALWNLNGSFGILNSGRSDCTYEPYNGYLLDRQMFEILQRTSTFSAYLKSRGALKIFPNPVQNEIFIENELWQGRTEIMVFDLFGRVLKKEVCYVNPNEIISLDLSALTPNLYIISVQNNCGSFSEKVLIKR